jgi:hypothetical protein
MEPPQQWQWDSRRNEYCIWTPAHGCWFYQSGAYVYPDDSTPRGNKYVVERLLLPLFPHRPAYADWESVNLYIPQIYMLLLLAAAHQKTQPIH